MKDITLKPKYSAQREQLLKLAVFLDSHLIDFLNVLIGKQANLAIHHDLQLDLSQENNKLLHEKLQKEITIKNITERILFWSELDDNQLATQVRNYASFLRKSLQDFKESELILYITHRISFFFISF